MSLLNNELKENLIPPHRQNSFYLFTERSHAGSPQKDESESLKSFEPALQLKINAISHELLSGKHEISRLMEVELENFLSLSTLNTP